MRGVIVLAAGKGSRMKSSTPKVFQSIAGLPILGHIIQTLQQCEFKQTIVMLSQGATLDALPEKLRNVDIAYQTVQDGTGGCVRDAKKVLDRDINDVLILYGDAPLISRASVNFAMEQGDNSDVCVLAIRVSGANSYGKLCLDKHNEVKGIVEADMLMETERPSDLCNVGLIIKRHILERYIENLPMHKAKQEHYVTDIISMSYNDGYKCTYCELPAEEMHGINTMADLAEVERIYQDKRRAYFMANGVKLIAPETVFFSYDTEIENDVVIYPYVVFGTGVHIKRGTVIESFSHITGAKVDSASVGPFARLRPGADIGKGAKIGNFVEVKNSEISEDAKVNHLSYIGDAFIGSRTNIGAGTITCNYDGYEKFKTVVGKGAFIGSNTALVAPVTVGDGAIIGAGSTITEDIADNAIAVARSTQCAKENAAIRYHERRKK